MTDQQSQGTEHPSAAEQLAEATDDPVEKFEPPEDIEYPAFEDLESDRHD